jgi:hypothetical protein
MQSTKSFSKNIELLFGAPISIGTVIQLYNFVFHSFQAEDRLEALDEVLVILPVSDFVSMVNAFTQVSTISVPVLPPFVHIYVPELNFNLYRACWVKIHPEHYIFAQY